MIASATARRVPENEVVRLQASLAAADATAQSARLEKERAEEALQKYEAENPYMFLPTAIPSGPMFLVEKHEEVFPNIVEWYDRLLLRTDAVVKAQLISHRELIETRPNIDTTSGYIYKPWLEFKFEVFDYLRGSGADEIIVRVPECPVLGCWYRDIQSAMIQATRRNEFLSEFDDALWDERESLLLLIDSCRGYYIFGSRGGGWGDYSITSVTHDRSTWLPIDDSSASSRPPRSAASVRYLTDAPSIIDKMLMSVPGEVESLPALPPSSAISLEEMRALIAETDSIISRGKEYVGCEIWKRHHADEVREGVYDDRTVSPYPVRFDSGQPAGHIVESSGFSGGFGGYDRAFITGRDQDLFVAEIDDPDNDEVTGYYIAVKSTRPLPAGEYKFFFDRQP